MRVVTGLPLCTATLATLGVLSLSGCSTPHVFVPPDPTWQRHTGQLVYTQDRTTLTGEVTVHRRSRDEFRLEFAKPGSPPLMVVNLDHHSARAEGYLMKRPWEGTAASAPRSVRPWLALRDAFLVPRPADLGGIKLWRGQVEYQNGQLADINLGFPEYHESFTFHFAPQPGGY